MKQYQLRAYQQTALEKIMWAQGLDGADLCVMPQGSGKSLVIAHLAKELKQPILIIQPSREILQQNLEKLLQYVSRKEVGVYSASLNEKVIKYYTFATIGSIYRKPEYFQHFRTIILDECDLLNVRNLNGMFTRFLSGINNPKVIGLTASPYRMQSLGRYRGFGLKLINRMQGFFWKRVIFNIHINDLITQEYLSPLLYMDYSIITHEEIPYNKSHTDFSMEGYEEKIESKEDKILKAIAYGASISKSVLVFCSSIAQAQKLQKITKNSAIVTGKTPKKERAKLIEDFKNHKIKIVYNVSVLAVGFDFPELDCIVLLRPSRSIRWYMQALGRGMRIAKGKKGCIVIDLTSTVKNLGRVETIRFTKETGSWELLTERGSFHNRPMYSQPQPQTFQQKFHRTFNPDVSLNRPTVHGGVQLSIRV